METRGRKRKPRGEWLFGEEDGNEVRKRAEERKMK